MTKAIAFVIKHKIASLIVLIVVIAGGFGIHKLMNPSPQSIMNSIEVKTVGYEGHGYAEVTKSKSNKEKIKKLYETMALLEAKRANFDSAVVKRVFENEKDPEVALSKFKDENSDIYAAKSSTDLSQNNAFYTRMKAIESTTSGSFDKNGDVGYIGFKDTSSDPAFKPFSKKIKVSGLKKQKKMNVKVSDFKVVYNKAKYDKAYAKELKEEQEEKQKSEAADSFSIYYGTPEENAKVHLQSDLDKYYNIYYKGKKMDKLSSIYDGWKIDKDNMETDITKATNIFVEGSTLLNLVDSNYSKHSEEGSIIYNLKEDKYYKVPIEK